MTTRRRDPWTILGVNYGASAEEIKREYRALAKRYHPDLNPGNEEARLRFQEVNEAYAELKARLLRSAERRAPVPDVSATAEAWGGEALVSEELRGPITITFEQAYRGGEVKATLDGTLKCQRCDGHGHRPGERELCSECSGIGVRGGPHAIAVRVPAGIPDGTKLPAYIAARPDRHVGDVVVRVKPSPLFQRPENDDDLVIELPITYSEAALGAAVRVPTPERWVSLRVPPGTADGKLLRLTGRGMPRPGSTERGHLYARVRIVMPGALTERQKRLLTELGEFDTDPRPATYGTSG